MNRFIIYSPESKSYVRIRHGWTSGHAAEVVNSYDSKEDAQIAKDLFDSLSDCIIQQVNKVVTFIPF